MGGFGASYSPVKLVGADELNREVLLLHSSLSAAAMNFILTEKFGQDPTWQRPSLFPALFFCSNHPVKCFG